MCLSEMRLQGLVCMQDDPKFWNPYRPILEHQTERVDPEVLIPYLKTLNPKPLNPNL